jgi:glutamyl-tRNA reductase
MMVAVLGINHKSADLGLREKLAEACIRRFGFKHYQLGFSFVMLSTCNRTEIYFSSNDLSLVHSKLLQQLRFDIEEEFEHKLYSYFHFDAFYHLAKVTSGLDSAILAESEIQGQVKTAYENALMKGRLSKELHFIFQKSLKIAKHIRSKFNISRGMPTLEGVLELMIKDFFKIEGNRDILFIGASDINYKLIQNFHSKKVANIALTNRSPISNIQPTVTIIPWEKKELWQSFKIIIIATKSFDYLLSSKDFDYFDSSNRLLIDLSMPRNINPDVALHKSIRLYNIDQVNNIVMLQRKAKIEDLHKVDAYLKTTVNIHVTGFKLREEMKNYLKAGI